MVSIKGLDKAAVLAALYNASRPQGMGFLQYNPEDMTVDVARRILNDHYVDFDYLAGRMMKINLRSDDEFDERLYDRDLGKGAAERAIAPLRAAAAAT
jgi:hypothetical protein